MSETLKQLNQKLDQLRAEVARLRHSPKADADRNKDNALIMQRNSEIDKLLAKRKEFER